MAGLFADALRVSPRRNIFCYNLGSLLLRDTLDLLQDPSWRIGDGLDCVVAAIDDELDISLGESGHALDHEAKKKKNVRKAVDLETTSRRVVCSYLKRRERCGSARARHATIINIGALVVFFDHRHLYKWSPRRCPFRILPISGVRRYPGCSEFGGLDAAAMS